MQGEIDLKQFKKLKRISKGSFGLVYQIQEKKTGEMYAAKIIDCDDDAERCNEMINREINIMMYANHPTIIKFIGYSKIDFHDESNVTIIMELAKNGSLREVLRQIQQGDGPKNYTNTTRQIILIGVARGMKYLHDRNIIHRDIKPENILLDENLQPHITDFGLAKFYEVGHSYSQTKFGGTLPYEAPEILNKQKYDRKVDVYSFSILMFEVLTDSVPYPELASGEMSDLEFMTKVVNKGYRPKFSVPVKDSLKELIEQCWSENPSNRPTFDEIFNKLTNKNNDEENFLLEDVDTDEMNLYIEDVTEITDSTEKLLSKISSLEEDNRQLKSEIKKLKLKDKKQSDANKTLEEEIKQLKGEIKKLKAENKKQSDTNKTLEEEIKQLKSENSKLKEKDKKQSDTNKSLEEEIRQLKSENAKLKEKDKKQSDTNKSLEDEIKQLKSENSKLKEKDKKQSDTNKTLEEKGHEKSKIEQMQVKKKTEESEAKSKPTKIKEKQHETSKAKIIVGGFDRYNLLGEKPNNKGIYGASAIGPPLSLSLDSSSLLSYSVYSEHSVLVTKSGSLLGIGDNSDGVISSSLMKTPITQFTEFSIKDHSGRQLAPISAVCCYWGTLYMFSKRSGRGRQLVYCDGDIKGGDPVFLDIGNEEPVSLFGGRCHAAAISDKGEVIFINRFAVKKSPNLRIAAVSLPDGEKASSVACLKDSVVVLSSNGRVFSSYIESESRVVRFSPVSELNEYEIVWLSGTYEHCLVVSMGGRVFGLGSNSSGQLGLNKETKSVSSFTEISSLLGYEIRAAYAGSSHSLFATREGKILSCGSNRNGELLFSRGPNYDDVYSPKETTITGDAIFCIAGFYLSSVFVGGDPPPNTPNMPIHHYQ